MERNTERLENEDWVGNSVWIYKGQARPRGRPNVTRLELDTLVGRGYEAIWLTLFIHCCHVLASIIDHIVALTHAVCYPEITV